MNKRLVLLVTSLIIGAAAVAGALLCEYKTIEGNIRWNYGYTEEEILSLPYFDLLAPKVENPDLLYDIESYSLGDGYIYLYLPDNVSEKSIVVYFRDEKGNYLARRVYDFSQKVMIGQWEVVLKHHNLPTLYFNCENVGIFDEMNNSETKNIICDGNMQVHVNDAYNADIPLTEASLQGRGSSSWDSCDSKKSYSLRLKKAQNLLGMGKNKNWNLIGNAFDVSLMRNVVFNQLSKDVGIKYQPEMKNINLYVDGKYLGVYTLTTKISVDKERIALQGGDIFYRKQPPVPTQPILYESDTWEDDGGDAPVVDVIFPEAATEADLNRAAKIFQNFIDTIEEPDTQDLSSVCDVKSLARYYWIMEASMNYDAWGRSVYLYYKKSDGKIYMGPVWDMDLTLGCPHPKGDIDYDVPEGWKIRYGGWYERLFMNSEFRQAVYDEYVYGGVRETLFEGISEFEKTKTDIGQDGITNYTLYGHSNDIGSLIDHGDTYDEYCENMIEFYRKRVEWIDRQMNEGMIN